MNRLYFVGSTPGITSSMADHRLLLRPSEIEHFARYVAQVFSLEVAPAPAPTDTQWISALVNDLKQHRGASIVIAGDEQPPIVHALTHLINHSLGNFNKTVFFSAPPEENPINQLNSLRTLVDELAAGQVELLVILGGNPVFTAPSDFEFARHLSRVPLSVYLGVEANETSTLCQWHVPETHFLESWSDARAFDGTATILQPLIAPLYDGISAHQLLAEIAESPASTDYQIVREHWRERNPSADFEAWRQKSLHDGVVAETKLSLKKVTLKYSAGNPVTEISPPTSRLEICFRPDPTIWDGRFANNGWLQELAKPITKLTWDNAALISAATAEKFSLSNGDVVKLRLNNSGTGVSPVSSEAHRQDARVTMPVWISPGQADHCITLHLGNGRAHVGRVGTGAGFNSYKLRASNSLWSASGVELRKTAEKFPLAGTQLFHNIDSDERQVLRAGTFEEFNSNSQFVSKSVESPARAETLYYPEEHHYDGYKWGMVIDLTTCIGCNACVLGCQSENNIPIVGKRQVAKGRAMQWIRIDTYFEGGPENPAMHHMPVPCMHCENAPCELVCPVAATVHDHEGLNVQIYNRCIGTRYCSNNCPYKVRRFNFFHYADEQTPSLKPMRNPQVTVRWRGVMEKCTYCIQRISSARITAKEEIRRVRDGEVVPACAQACPTDAIIFGDISDPNSRVAKLREHSLKYEMLGQLNTRPRTTYLARLKNPNPELEEKT